MARKHRLLIGGIGDDAHSVGIGLLALGFREENFLVRNLGIRNDLADFRRHAESFDIIMISNNNGHAELYLQDFGYLLHSLRLSVSEPKLWYLGGNLSVSESDFSVKRKFIRLGFTNVFPKPISFEQILAEVRKDIAKHNIHPREGDRQEEYTPFRRSGRDLDDISDERWEPERLEAEREVVLKEWETGRGVDLAAPPAKQVPHKNLDHVLWSAKSRGAGPLLQPRTGVADLERQIELLRYLERCGIDIASAQLDAASRSKLYDKAKLGVSLSKERNNSTLNGFPVPVHGVPGMSRLVESLNIPFQLRAGGNDHRFTYEIALRGGATGVEGGFVCYLFPYDKHASPRESLRHWQYVDRLCGLYCERQGVLINREYFGTLTANLIEPSLAIVVNIVQAILSAKQGVRSISLGYAEQGNRAQDIAALRVLERLAKRYLRKYGLRGCRVTTVFHQYMAAFPKNTARAEELIFNSAITGTLAGATKIMTKTLVEAFKIPSREENARGVSIVRKGVLAAAAAEAPAAVAAEERLLEMEVGQLMGAIEELGHGSVARGTIRAFEEGYLDIPFSPNVHNKNEVVTLRDRGGAVRFASFGQLPFSARVKEFHSARMDERKMLERDPKVFSLLEKDLSRIWKSDYLRWPIDDAYVN